MTTVPIGLSAFERPFAQAPPVRLVNRFVEQTPANQVEGASLLSRPGTSLEAAFGFGKYRGGITEPGAFGGDLFVTMGETVFRHNDTESIALNGVLATSGIPSKTIVTGPGFEHLFVADGTALFVYDGISAAKGTLTASGAIAEGDEIEIDGVHYRWTGGDVNAGTPDGSAGSPFLVDLGVDTPEALQNAFNAINFEGSPGVDYSDTITAAHTTVKATAVDDTTLGVEARERGNAGNDISTTVVTGANISWGAETLEGGGVHALNGVATPDDVGIVSLTTIASFVIAVAAQSQRFFWINPGEKTIDALNFASAESLPDQIISAMTVADQFWLFGQSSTEAWVPTGDANIPFQPIRGQAFSRGIVDGTAVKVNDLVLVVGNDGIVYAVGGGVERVSNHGIEEKVRTALRKERENG